MLNYFLIFLLTWKAYANTNNQYLVCKSVSNIFQEGILVKTNQTLRGRQGSPGKRGPKGFRGPEGPPGPQGPAAIVDYTRINQTIQSELLKIKRKIQCIEGVAIGAVCYKLPYRVGPGVNFTQADAICRYRGGELAEIPTEQVYNTVYEYIKQSSYYTINGKSINNAIIHIWLGSSYNRGRGVQLRNGALGYVRWYPNYPSSRPLATNMAMTINLNPSSTTKGMWNYEPSYSSNTVSLCQFNLV